MAELISYLKDYEKRLGKKLSVSIYGYGTTGKAIYEKIKGEFDVTIRDLCTTIDGAEECRRLLGKSAESEIFEDAVILSPSIRRDSAQLLSALKRGALITSDTEIFFEGNGIPTFGITGSDGKTTTATLTHLMLSGLHKSALCGNIGAPFCTLNKGDADAVVAELSSFNLTYLKPRTVRASITNITPNHLNWHTDYAEYTWAKLNILDNAREIVLPFDKDILKHVDREVFALFSTKVSYLDMKSARRAELYYSIDDGWIMLNGERLIAISDITRREEYNIKNFMCALGLSAGYTTQDVITEVARSFKGVRHRAEVVAKIDGITYVDSSIDTSPSRVLATLSSINGRVNVILGGRGKGLAIEPILPILRERAEYIAIYGEVRTEYYEILRKFGFSSERLCATEKFDEAFAFVNDNRHHADVILLSPACTGYGEFRDYIERGERFRQLVQNITKQRK